jgi:hypothetical protein
MVGVRERLHCWVVTVGNFFFHYRNALLPVFIFAVLTLKPKVMFGNPLADRALRATGISLAYSGKPFDF